jgi:tetratricopeptide (TPR) repeat protein
MAGRGTARNGVIPLTSMTRARCIRRSPFDAQRRAAALAVAAAAAAFASAPWATGCGTGTAAAGGAGARPRDRSKLYTDELPDGGGHVAMGDRARGDDGSLLLRAREVHPDPAVLALVPLGPRPGWAADLDAARVKLRDLERTLMESPRRYDLNALTSPADSNLDLLLGATGPELSPFTAVRAGPGGKELYLLRPPTAADDAWHRADKAFAAGELGVARAALDEVLKAAPDLPRALVLLGEIAERADKDLPKAVALYRRAAAANPVDSEAHRLLADALLATGDAAGAREEVMRALLYQPANVLAWARLSALEKGAEVASPRFDPAVRVELRPSGAIEVGYLDADDSFAVPYALCKAAMRYEPALWEDVTGLHGPYVRSAMEEEHCVRLVLAAYLDARAAADAKSGDGHAIPYLEHMLAIEKAGMLRQFVLFDVIGTRAPHRVALLPDEEQARILEYLRKFATHAPGGRGTDI